MNEKPFYQEQILDHYHNPRNNGSLEYSNISSGVYNPSCGDSVKIEGVVFEDHLIKALFQGEGCIISQAAASILIEFSLNKSIKEILAISSNQIKEMVGINLGPTRLRCALLALEALKGALHEYLKSDDVR